MLTNGIILCFLQERFGDDIDIMAGKKKIGTKGIDEYSNADTDKLADDSDLDIDTCKLIEVTQHKSQCFGCLFR